MSGTEVSRAGRWAFGITGLCAVLGILLSIGLSIFNVYPPLPPTKPHTVGVNPDGIAGALGRLFDSVSYFTEISNIIAAVVLLTLAFSTVRPTPVWRALRMDSLVMISVTGLVYQLVLAPGVVLHGWEYVSNGLVHILVPILTVVTFLIWGPRGWFRWTTMFTALILPIAWLVYALIRGAVIGAYPYPFLNVANLGLATTLINVSFVTVLGLILGLIYWGLDRLLSRRIRS